MNKSSILVTNDDGIDSPGILALVESVKSFGNVTVIAPANPMSGVGHAITMRKAIRIEECQIFGTEIKAFRLGGTPADCVKYAFAHVFDNKPDLVVSGINHGSNASVNLLYSGTMAAAMEAAIVGVPAFAFSLCDYDEKADLNLSKKIVREVIENFYCRKYNGNLLFNINIPKVTENEFRGLKWSRQAKARWVEKFVPDETNPDSNYYWLTGEFECFDTDKETDIWALNNNFASITPVSFDLTDFRELNFYLNGNNGK